ncbi:MAG: flagellar biosynthetic protein FliR [Lacunisphaera sp.]
MSVDYLLTWMMVLLRSIGIVMLLPTLAGRPLPVTVRMGLSLCLATLVAGIVPPANLPLGSWPLVYAAAGEVIMGLAMGFVARMTFSAVEMTGRIITSEIGFVASPGLGVPEPANEPLAAFLAVFTGVIFFALGGHLTAITAFARSFSFAPPGHPLFQSAAPEFFIAITGHVLELGLRMAAPFIALNFLVTLAFSVLGRAVPKMNVFVLSFSVRLFVGLILLAGSGALIGRYLYVEFGNMPLDMLRLLAGP